MTIHNAPQLCDLKEILYCDICAKPVADDDCIQCQKCRKIVCEKHFYATSDGDTCSSCVEGE